MSQESVSGAAGGNPYYAQQQRVSPPDLDAGAAVLRSGDVQRLNRKALLFLAGIVALLAMAIVWMVRAAGSGSDTPAVSREQAVVIPNLPRTPTNPSLEAPPLPPAPPLPVLPSLPVNEPMAPPSSAYGLPSMPSGPSLLERRMAGGNPGNAAGHARDPYVEAMLAGIPGGGQSEQPQATTPVASAARHIARPDALLVRGTYIRCVLETRIITDIPGFTSCVVTEPVYSLNGRRLLLPKGSKVLGSYDMEPRGPRVAVVWDRITTPGGVDVSMSSPGVDGLGGAGHPGRYSAHWGSRIASALLVSLVSDAFKYAAAEHGPESSTIGAGGVVVQSPYESATARSMERLANEMLDNRRPPTVTIHHGTVVNVYVARDIDFSGVLAQL